MKTVLIFLSLSICLSNAAILTTKFPFVNIKKGELLWSDDFNYNGSPDPNFWYLQSQTVNNYYKISNAWKDENAYVSGGNLTLVAKKESYAGKNYTSAAIVSRRGFKYGIFEMRAKLGIGRGTWSNLWFFSDDRKSSRWPADGEIDVVEVVDSTTYLHNRVQGTVHTSKFDDPINYPSTYRDKSMTGTTVISDMSTEFHVYTLDWNADRLIFYVDGYQYQMVKNDGTQAGYPFTRSMNILINLKIGIPGDTWSGINGIDDSIFPVHHVIDYVRQYALPDSQPITNSISWEYLPGNITWAPACNFIGNDMKKESTRMPVQNQCEWKCQYNVGCTHFVWTNATCFMKNGTVSEKDAVISNDPNMVCGINTRIK